jgi:hypothetical protein
MAAAGGRLVGLWSGFLASIFRARDLLACDVRLGLIFWCGRCPAVAPGGRGSTALVFLLPGRRVCSGWLAGREGLQAGDRGGDVRGPWPAFGGAEPQAAAAAGQASSHIVTQFITDRAPELLAAVDRTEYRLAGVLTD